MVEDGVEGGAVDDSAFLVLECVGEGETHEAIGFADTAGTFDGDPSGLMMACDAFLPKFMAKLVDVGFGFEAVDFCG